MEKELSDKVSKIMEQMSDMPVIGTRIYKSKDGKYIINEVRIKTIKPTNYYDAIIKSKKNDFYSDASENDTYKGGEDDRSY